MRALASFIMHGRVQAIGTVVSLALLSLIVSPLAIFTTAGVALVTLVHGYREGLVNLIAATVIIAVFYWDSVEPTCDRFRVSIKVLVTGLAISQYRFNSSLNVTRHSCSCGVKLFDSIRILFLY